MRAYSPFGSQTYAHKKYFESTANTQTPTGMGKAPKPACVKCARTDSVKTLGGGTAPRYRYRCEQCGARWQQVPLSKLKSGGDPMILTEEDQRTMRTYRCPLCGLPKRKHVCAGFVEIESALP